MNFEFDKNKSSANLLKHGIDFRQAQKLWADEFLLRIKAVTAKENRYLFIGQIAEKCYTAIATYRGENVRIISVRRARKKEEEFYEKNKV